MTKFFALWMMFSLSEGALAGRCCNNPTVWSFKNLSKSPIKLTCTLERSVAWAGKTVTMETEVIRPGATFNYTWDSGWYADGMGMLPGSWSCRPADPKLAKDAKPLKFKTDWGENATIKWSKRVYATKSSS